jgi:hypothetical protein
VNYGFVGTGWTTNRKAWFNDGADNWNVIRDSAGVPYTSSGEGGSIEVEISNIFPNADGGKTYCTLGGLNKIVVDPGGSWGENDWRGVATHEMGHAHGLGHTGFGDSLDGSAPTMTGGCYAGASFAAMISTEQDDWAGLSSLFTDTSGSSLISAHANQSFEHGFSFWGTTGSPAVVAHTSGGADGPGYVRFSGYGTAIYQTVRVVDANDFTGRVNFRRWNSTDGGTIVVELLTRRLDYGSAPSNCEFYNNWNLDSPSVIENWTVKGSKTLSPSGSWAWEDLPEWTGGRSWEGIDVRIRVWSYMTTAAGGSTYIRIDNARARHS